MRLRVNVYKGNLGTLLMTSRKACQQVMMMGNDYEAMGVALRKGNPDLETTMFADVTEVPATDTDSHVVSSNEPKAKVSFRCVAIFSSVLFTVIRS